MNNRERALASLSHRQPDKIPYDILFTQKSRAKLVEFYGDPEFVSRLGNCLTWLGRESAQGWKEVEPDLWEDQFDVQWGRTIDKDIGGGYIAAPSHSIPADAKPENVAALIEVLQSQ